MLWEKGLVEDLGISWPDLEQLAILPRFKDRSIDNLLGAIAESTAAVASLTVRVRIRFVGERAPEY